jgi:hypothetical protein
MASTADAAGVPDVMLESVKGARVDLSTSTGKLMSGTLQAFDKDVVVMFMDDNSVITVPRAEVLAIRVVQQPVNSLPPQRAPVYAPQQAPQQAPYSAYQAGPPPPRAKSASELAQIEALRSAGLNEMARGRALNTAALATGIPAILGCILGPIALGVGAEDGDAEAMEVGAVGLILCGALGPPTAALDISGDVLRGSGAAKVRQADAMMSGRNLFRPTNFRFSAGPTREGGRLAMSFNF